MSKGYGMWIRDSVASPGSWCWTSMPAMNVPEATRGLAAELLAWADAHDTVTIIIPKKTVEYYARQLPYFGNPDAETVRIAARKALGMEP